MKDHSRKRFEEAVELEVALIAQMREMAPDLSKGDTSILHLRVAAQVLRDKEVANPLPDRLRRILRSIAGDGRGEGGGGSLAVRQLDGETMRLTLQREWPVLEETAEIRREGARLLLNHLLACLPPGIQGKDLLAETTLGQLLGAIEADLIIKSRIRHPEKLLDRALLWLHEQEVIRLHKGLAVFRPAMTIRLEKENRGFAKADFEPLRLYYQGQTLQIHVMKEFAKRPRPRPMLCGWLWTTLPSSKTISYVAGCRIGAMNWSGRPLRNRGDPSSKASTIQVKSASLPTSGSRQTCWCSPVLALVRRGYWCIASPTWCGQNAKIRAASWPWPTTGTRRSKSVGVSET